ncbi:MAG: hypothetical protein C4538_04180 [Nitrospiraceae bacterium]|nr:MAG: hypothetical protein C4538_04180 [Nitrospiraceae bacterium]
MNPVKAILLSLLVLGLVCSFAFAAHHTPEERGKTLFNDPKSFGGSTACSSCHPDGRGLEKAGMMGKTAWVTPAGTYKSLEEAINICITMANKGKAIETKSGEMKDMVAYIKSLGMKEMHHEMPMKK